MRMTYRVLAYVIALAVIVQAAGIGFALAGLGKWIDDGGVLTKQVLDSRTEQFTGTSGLAVHGINGTLLIPLFVLALLVVSFFARVPGGTRLAFVEVGLVAVQVVLGFALLGLPYLALLHVINAFAILAVAVLAARRVGRGGPVGQRGLEDAAADRPT